MLLNVLGPRECISNDAFHTRSNNHILADQSFVVKSLFSYFIVLCFLSIFFLLKFILLYCLFSWVLLWLLILINDAVLKNITDKFSEKEERGMERTFGSAVVWFGPEEVTSKASQCLLTANTWADGRLLWGPPVCSSKIFQQTLGLLTREIGPESVWGRFLNIRSEKNIFSISRRWWILTKLVESIS